MSMGIGVSTIRDEESPLNTCFYFQDDFSLFVNQEDCQGVFDAYASEPVPAGFTLQDVFEELGARPNSLWVDDERVDPEDYDYLLVGCESGGALIAHSFLYDDLLCDFPRVGEIAHSLSMATLLQQEPQREVFLSFGRYVLSFDRKDALDIAYQSPALTGEAMRAQNFHDIQEENQVLKKQMAELEAQNVFLEQTLEDLKGMIDLDGSERAFLDQYHSLKTSEVKTQQELDTCEDGIRRYKDVMREASDTAYEISSYNWQEKKRALLNMLDQNSR